MLFCAIALVAMSGVAKAADQSENSSIKNSEIVSNFAFERDIKVLDVFATGFTYKIYDSKGALTAEGTYYCNGSESCTQDFALWLFNATPKGGSATSNPI